MNKEKYKTFISGKEVPVEDIAFCRLETRKQDTLTLVVYGNIETVNSETFSRAIVFDVKSYDEAELIVDNINVVRLERREKELKALRMIDDRDR
ncbi:hypothetical protein VHTUMSATKI_37740 [Vibrio harveyi]|uniref:hypothetical protein n=1 Tax=Vibrio harveyi TaxID=669 RepID=UPI0027FAC9AB|nr:hypothetical protein [Vibrio harveyi]